MKQIHTLVDDIYDVLKTNKAAEGVDVDKVIDEFGDAMKDVLKRVVTENEDKRTLRMSNIGKQDLIPMVST